ncbi:MAG: hypothetical protein A3F90_06395 [Deltaproteobacteria bacterium RIFCSPLOWO2_12_FULL_60_19]|nr:MAG: hypothetical protein A3F90_06395 [Deltaproteobacteria bacterium RIFCSPLOWO2_12_FULL_60_19]
MSNPITARKSTKQTGEWEAALGRWTTPSLVALLTLTAFFPVLQNQFVDWDDAKILIENPHYRGLGWAQLRWMFTTFYMGHYQPLSWMTFGTDYLLWGMDPFGYHLTNLLLHATNAVVFYFIAFRLLSLTISVPDLPGLSGVIAPKLAAGFAALFFAVHPLRVESVAWATERRDVLSGFFVLLTVLFYLRSAAVETGPFRRRWMRTAVLFYVLSLLAKASGVVLPFVLLLLDIYPLKRLGGGPGKRFEPAHAREFIERWFGRAARAVWLEKLPLLIPAALFGAAAILAQREAGALSSVEKYGFLARASQAFYGLAFYPLKTVLPLGLSPLYEMPRYFWSLTWSFILSGIVVTAASLILYLARRRWPAGLACWVCYGVILSPVLGIFQAGPQLVADRYSYLSCLGWAVLAGAGLLQCWRLWLRERISALGFKLTQGSAAGIILLLAALTWQQAQVWRDGETLWRHAIAVAPSRVAYSNLADLLRTDGKTEEAIENYRQALRLNPVHWHAHHELAILLEGQGKTDVAEEHYRSALTIKPSSVEAHYNLGMLLAERKEFEQAMAQFREVLRLSPDHAEAHSALGAVLSNLGRLQEAVAHLQKAVKIKPDFADTHRNLGQLLAARGDLDQGIDHFRQAVSLEPDFAEAHESLGRALVLLGRKDEAARHLQEAVRILKSRGEAGRVP